MNGVPHAVLTAIALGTNEMRLLYRCISFVCNIQYVSRVHHRPASTLLLDSSRLLRTKARSKGSAQARLGARPSSSSSVGTSNSGSSSGPSPSA